MKRFLLLSILTLCCISTQLLSAASFEIIPAAKNKDPGTTVDCVAGTTPEGGTGKCVDIKGSTVRSRYNHVANDTGNTTLGDQFATGIFSWNGVLNYIVYIVKFISQAGIFVGALMIIVAGYKYASAVFTGATPSMKDVTNAIAGVLVIIFSYAIIRVLTAAFL